jgi:hypothetical protein
MLEKSIRPMFRRVLGVFALTGTLVTITCATASARYNDWRDRRWEPAPRENSLPKADPAAPELDPAAIASGIALLAGGILLLNERRRKNGR